MTPVRKVRLGLIGAGNIVQKAHAPIVRTFDDVRIEWVCDQQLDRARDLADAFDIPAAYQSVDDCPDVDVVLVAVPVGARRAVLEKTIPRGWHAFCEKPFAATLDDHQWMVAEAKERGLRLGVALMRRYYDSTEIARRLLGSSILGTIELVLAGEGTRVRATGRGDDWYQASGPASGGGVLFEHGSHLVDQVFTICGVETYRIEHSSRRLVGDLDFETQVQGELLFEGQQPARFAMVVTRLNDVYNGIDVRCQNGGLRVGPDPAGTVELVNADGEVAARLGAPRDTNTAGNQAIRTEWRSFIAACRRSPVFSDWDTGLLNTSFMTACYQFEATSNGASGDAKTARRGLAT